MKSIYRQNPTIFSFFSTKTLKYLPIYYPSSWLPKNTLPIHKSTISLSRTWYFSLIYLTDKQNIQKTHLVVSKYAYRREMGCVTFFFPWIFSAGPLYSRSFSETNSIPIFLDQPTKSLSSGHQNGLVFSNLSSLLWRRLLYTPDTFVKRDK